MPLMSIEEEVPQPQFGDVKRVAEIVGLSTRTLIRARLYEPEKSPPFFRVGRRVLYPLTGENSLESWTSARARACRDALA